MSANSEDGGFEQPEKVPMATILRLADTEPRRALEILDGMPREDPDLDFCVLARFKAYSMLAFQPFIAANVPSSSDAQELLRAAEPDTIDLCEQAVQEIAKLELGKVEAYFLTGREFDGSADTEPGGERQKADAVCMILDRLIPGRVQQLRGRTALSYFGPNRVGGLSLQSALEPEGVDRLVQVLFAAPRTIRSVIAFEVLEKTTGSKMVRFRAFEQATDQRPEIDPGTSIGVLTLAEDGLGHFQESM